MRNPVFIIVILAAAALGYFVFSQDTSQWMTQENDQIVSTVFYGLLIVLLLSGLGMRNIRLGEVSRNLAVWLLITVMLAAGYQYRYELNQVATRLGAGFMTGEPVTLGNDDSGRARMMVERDPGGHFFVRAQVNGHTIRALLDTGASNTLLTMRDATAAGIDTGSLNFNVPVSTANGTTFVASARISELRIGDISRGSQRIYVANENSLRETLIGMSFINSLSSFELRGNRVILYD